MIQDSYTRIYSKRHLFADKTYDSMHSQLTLSPSKTALYAIFQSNDFNDWDFSTLQNYCNPVRSTLKFTVTLSLWQTYTPSILKSYSHYLRLINIGFIRVFSFSSQTQIIAYSWAFKSSPQITFFPPKVSQPIRNDSL